MTYKLRQENNTNIVQSADDRKSYTDKMQWLRDRLKEIGKKPIHLAKHLGIAPARVYEMQNGTRKMQPEEIASAARFLEWSEAQLLAALTGRTPVATGSQPPIHNSEIFERRPLKQGDAPIPPLVVYRSAPGDGGAKGGWMLHPEPAGEVERPEFLRFSKKAFATKILDDLNAPAYRKRDLILVDPETPYVLQDDCIFTGTSPAMSHCGQLVKDTHSHWIIHQYGAKGDREIPKATFPFAWPIVGRYNRR